MFIILEIYFILPLVSHKLRLADCQLYFDNYQNIIVQEVSAQSRKKWLTAVFQTILIIYGVQFMNNLWEWLEHHFSWHVNGNLFHTCQSCKCLKNTFLEYFWHFLGESFQYQPASLCGQGTVLCYRECSVSVKSLLANKAITSAHYMRLGRKSYFPMSRTGFSMDDPTFSRALPLLPEPSFSNLKC